MFVSSLYISAHSAWLFHTLLSRLFGMVSALPLLLAALSIVGPSPATAAPQFGGQGRLFTGAHNARNPLREHLKRSVTSDASSVKGRSFDFVIVGGGVAGLTLANRLSEWGNQSVLVIEAGGDGSDVEERQSVPGYAYHKGLSSKSPYAWNFTTSPQVSSIQAACLTTGRVLRHSEELSPRPWTGRLWCRQWHVLGPCCQLRVRCVGEWV